MTTLDVGSVLATFEATVGRDLVWPVDWTVGLDLPEYQDPDVAIATGWANIVVPAGAFVFFRFLDDDGWLQRIGGSYSRSLAARRELTLHETIHVGDHISGEVVVAEQWESESRSGQPQRWVTLHTTYRRGEHVCLEEAVTYVTRGDV